MNGVLQEGWEDTVLSLMALIKGNTEKTENPLLPSAVFPHIFMGEGKNADCRSAAAVIEKKTLYPHFMRHILIGKGGRNHGNQRR